MRQEFKIFGIPMNLNEYRNAHFQVLNQQKKMWERLTIAESIAQKIQPVKRCQLTIHYFFKDRRKHDPDNYAASLKFILDGLVKAKILPDDNFDVIDSITIRQGGIDKKPYLIIQMDEIDA